MNFSNSTFIKSLFDKTSSNSTNSSNHNINNFTDALHHVRSLVIHDSFNGVPVDQYYTFPLFNNVHSTDFFNAMSKKFSSTHKLSNSRNVIEYLDSLIKLVPCNLAPFIKATCPPFLKAHLFESPDNNPSLILSLVDAADQLNSIQTLLPNKFKDTYTAFLTSISFQTVGLQTIDLTNYPDFKCYIPELVFHLQMISPLYQCNFNTASLTKFNVRPGFHYDLFRLDVAKLHCFKLNTGPTTLDMSNQTTLTPFMTLFTPHFLCYLFTKHIVHLKSKHDTNVFDPNSHININHVCMIPIVLLAMLFGRKIRSDFLKLFSRFYHADLLNFDPDYLGNDYGAALFLVDVFHGNFSSILTNQTVPPNPFHFPNSFLQLSSSMLPHIKTSTVALHEFLYHLHLLYALLPKSDSILMPFLSALPKCFDIYHSLPSFKDSFQIPLNPPNNTLNPFHTHRTIRINPSIIDLNYNYSYHNSPAFLHAPSRNRSGQSRAFSPVSSVGNSFSSNMGSSLTIPAISILSVPSSPVSPPLPDSSINDSPDEVNLVSPCIVASESKSKKSKNKSNATLILRVKNSKTSSNAPNTDTSNVPIRVSKSVSKPRVDPMLLGLTPGSVLTPCLTDSRLRPQRRPTNIFDSSVPTSSVFYPSVSTTDVPDIVDLTDTPISDAKTGSKPYKSHNPRKK